MKKSKSLLIFILFTFSFALGPWQMTGQVHSELNWKTIQTEHYRVHYHDGIEAIAQQGASIAEQVHPILIKQVGIETTPMIDIIFTTEDEIMNGYAMWTNQTFIWVDQNDAAIWLENGKWLYQVLSHELQHIMFFNAVKTWMPEPWAWMFSDTPGWFVEGLAEYFTEKWRPHRADISHKRHVLKNDMDEMDPHHDGYSKLLMMSEKWGDSTIVELLQWRNDFKLFNFEDAFDEVTGQSVHQFNEEWRRKMNTYYYGYRAQKESYNDVGDVASLPISKMSSFTFSSDSMRIAMVGKDDKNQFDRSLFIATQDTTTEQPNWFSTLFSGDDDDNQDSTKTETPKFDKDEVDFGSFHSSMSWSPDHKSLAYAKYRYGKHGSILWDIRILNTETGEKRWVTTDERATYPFWNNDGSGLYAVHHQNGIANIISIDLETNAISPVTSFTEDIQIISPALSPDGNQIAYVKSSTEGNMDIYLWDLAAKSEKQLMDTDEVDYLPIWHPDGTAISYTSHKGSTPNLHTINVDDKKSTMVTDASEGIWGAQWAPKTDKIMARTLNDVDSVRIVSIDPFRKTTTTELNIRDEFTTWRTHTPEFVLENIDQDSVLTNTSISDYKFYKFPKHFTSYLLPLSGPLGMTVWEDALGKHLFQTFGGTSDWTLENPFYMINYTNAQHGPLWGVNYYQNVNYSYRDYGESTSGLLEVFNGISLWTSLPFNCGNSMSANHNLLSSISVLDRIVPFKPFESITTSGDTIFHDFDSNHLGSPESGLETLISLDYKFINRRGHKSNISLPNNGYGIRVKLDVSTTLLDGAFDYQRLTFDSFSNLKFGPGVLFLRGKSESLWGNPPNQEYVGITKDPAIYFPGSTGTGGIRENMNLRGYNNYVTGDQLLYFTSELRIPFIPILPANVLGITIGDISGALFTDTGLVWDRGSDAEKPILTAGYELKYAWKLGGSPLFYTSMGYAQELNDWEAGNEPTYYVRYALVNPF
ncbi:MAG: PD40 domain-containing protein [Candidatus Marinimicrobia bacterium]|nr:PD40 domain-containing protein [Candidatus Neomarinimicrobiota bacterium]